MAPRIFRLFSGMRSYAAGISHDGSMCWLDCCYLPTRTCVCPYGRGGANIGGAFLVPAALCLSFVVSGWLIGKARPRSRYSLRQAARWSAVGVALLIYGGNSTWAWTKSGFTLQGDALAILAFFAFVLVLISYHCADYGLRTSRVAKKPTRSSASGLAGPFSPGGGSGTLCR